MHLPPRKDAENRLKIPDFAQPTPNGGVVTRNVSRLNDACSIGERSIKVPMLSVEYRYKILKKLEIEPQISQRDLARDLGISVGRANYCIQALIAKGLIKVNNFKNNQNKKAYMYFLTPKGIAEKINATSRFLKIKTDEYEALQREIEGLRNEVNQ